MGYFHLQRTCCANELLEDVKRLVEEKQKSLDSSVFVNQM